ncbi:MAG: hypothetical protein IJU86_01895 [Firmicutes bacterium]|nr:hypothetical protein [Bacillota bacterium]
MVSLKKDGNHQYFDNENLKFINFGTVLQLNSTVEEAELRDNDYIIVLDAKYLQGNKPMWFKTLISLAIIFAVLSILAFALEFALALKIIFVVVAVICSIGLILSGLVHCCKKENPMGKNINGYGPESEYYNNNIENINNLYGNYPVQYQNQYQGQYPGKDSNQY